MLVPQRHPPVSGVRQARQWDDDWDDDAIPRDAAGFTTNPTQILMMNSRGEPIIDTSLPYAALQSQCWAILEWRRQQPW